MERVFLFSLAWMSGVGGAVGVEAVSGALAVDGATLVTFQRLVVVDCEAVPTELTTGAVGVAAGVAVGVAATTTTLGRVGRLDDIGTEVNEGDPKELNVGVTTF